MGDGEMEEEKQDEESMFSGLGWMLSDFCHWPSDNYGLLCVWETCDTVTCGIFLQRIGHRSRPFLPR